MKDRINIVFEGTCVGWKAPKCNRGRHYPCDHYAQYKSDLTFFIQSVPWGTFPATNKKTRYRLDIKVYIKKDIGDRTNFQKCIEDCIEDAGLVFNDKAIIDGRTQVFAGDDNPRIEFTLEEIER